MEYGVVEKALGSLAQPTVPTGTQKSAVVL